MIIAIKTDEPLAEMYILQGSVVAQKQWQAHKLLTETIHITLQELLDSAKTQLQSLEGVIFYEGPGSFTGLRIGCSVANALAASYDVPIAVSNGEDWLAKGQELLQKGKGAKAVEPNYGSDPYITKPK